MLQVDAFCDTLRLVWEVTNSSCHAVVARQRGSRTLETVPKSESLKAAYSLVLVVTMRDRIMCTTTT